MITRISYPKVFLIAFGVIIIFTLLLCTYLFVQQKTYLLEEEADPAETVDGDRRGSDVVETGLDPQSDLQKSKVYAREEGYYLSE